MSTKINQDIEAKFTELLNRLDWLDNERRSSSRRLANLEKQVVALDKEIKERDLRLQNQDAKIKRMSAEISRLGQFETQIPLIREETEKLVDKVDQKRVQSQSEIDKMRQAEQKAIQRDIATLRHDIDSMSTLHRDMQLRESEEVRLAGLINELKTSQTGIGRDIENANLELSFLQEASSSNAQTITEFQSRFQDVNKRLDTLQNQADTSASQMVKIQSSQQASSDNIESFRTAIKEMNDQIQIGELERRQRIDAIEAAVEDHRAVMDRYANEWTEYIEQYKAAKMALKNLEDWIRKADQGQLEIREQSRVEIERARTRWESFIEENEKRLKNFEIDLEQHINSLQRRNKSLGEQVEELSQLGKQRQETLDTLWRIQTAQSDAIKKWPRIFIEEVEKSLAQNPNSRRQPALVPVREE